MSNQSNEHQYYSLEWNLSSGRNDYLLSQSRRGLYVLAHGYGGTYQKPCAQIAGESVFQFLDRQQQDPESTLPFVLRKSNSLAANVLLNSVLFANHQLLKWNSDQKEAAKKGASSIAAALMDEGVLHLATVGSVEVWVFRGGRLAEVVGPNNYARYVDPTLTDTPWSWSVPLSAVGVHEDLEPRIQTWRVQEGDLVLCCADRLPLMKKQALLAQAAQGWEALDHWIRTDSMRPTQGERSLFCLRF